MQQFNHENLTKVFKFMKKKVIKCNYYPKRANVIIGKKGGCDKCYDKLIEAYRRHIRKEHKQKRIIEF